MAVQAKPGIILSGETPVDSKKRYEMCLRYVEDVLGAVNSGKSIPLGPSSAPLAPPVPDPVAVQAGKRTKVVYCAPHPDDESLSGALALRLRLEGGVQVTNVAITMGSDLGQRARRLRELESACRVLGFDLVVPKGSMGFERVNLKEWREHPQEWAEKVQSLRTCARKPARFRWFIARRCELDRWKRRLEQPHQLEHWCAARRCG